MESVEKREVIVSAEEECEKITRRLQEMQWIFSDQGNFAEALKLQQQMMGARFMRDAIQSRYGQVEK